jgi:non-ribosomal peptide synthetase component F
MSAASLVDWIEKGVSHTHPDKPAARGEQGEVSWGELVRGAHAVSSFLCDAGLGRGDRIGLWMDKSPRCLQALLGILGAGAAYVPLDPRGPAVHATAIARDWRLSALFVDGPRRRELPAVLRESGVQLAVVDAPVIGPWEEAALARVARVELLADVLEFPASEPARPAPADLACVLHTSGTTGRPTGVAHTHGSVLSFARWACNRFALRADDVLVSHAPFHLDPSIADLFASLGAGASLRLLSPAEAMLPPYLVRMLDPWGVSVWHSVPSALVAMLEKGGLEAHPPARLRLVLLAGEDVPVAQLRRLRRALPDATLETLFGPTETDALTHQVVSPEPPERPGGSDAPPVTALGRE